MESGGCDLRAAVSECVSRLDHALSSGRLASSALPQVSTAAGGQAPLMQFSKHAALSDSLLQSQLVEKTCRAWTATANPLALIEYLQLVCEASSSSEPIRTCIRKSILPRLIVDQLQSENTKTNYKRDSLMFRLVVCHLSLLHHLVKYPGVARSQLQILNAVQVVSFYRKSSDIPIRNLSLLILTHISEDASDASQEDIELLIFICSQTINERSKASALGLLDLLLGIRSLLLFPGNAAVFVSRGGLDLSQRVCQSDQSRETWHLALECLWHCAFCPELAERMRSHDVWTNVIDFCSSQHESLHGAALGIIREVEGKRVPRSVSSSKSVSEHDGRHTMISYSWSQQDLAIRLRDALVSAGREVWFDLERMRGDVLDRMAEGVENASSVILCISSAYACSANCRKEASYANDVQAWPDQRGVPQIIPVIAEPDYRPSGWLGILVAGKLYYRLHEDFDDNFKRLLQAIPS